MTRRLWVVLFLSVLGAGCGTTRATDTQRTATEQLLISDAVDNVVDQMDFSGLAGTRVFLDTQYFKGAVDENYVASTLREKLSADGALLVADREQADVIAEPRVGSLGTDRSEWFIGIPQITVVPVGVLPAGVPPAFPEIPVIKKSKQYGTAKIYVFAYDKETGQMIADSGTQRSATDSNSLWLLGFGPFETGSVRGKIRLAGDPLPTLPLSGNAGDRPVHGLAKVPGAPKRQPFKLPPRTASTTANRPAAVRIEPHLAPVDDDQKPASN